MKQIISIQYLRAVAAIGVVLHHALVSPFLSKDIKPPDTIGEAGVDLFFVISGFIMWLTTRQRETTSLDFARHRVVRIVPMYWLCTFAYLIIQLSGRSSGAVSVHDVIRSLLFIPAFDPQLGQKISAFYFLGWTLMYEMFFYALLTVVLTTPQTLQLTIVTSALICLSILGATVSFDSGMSFAYTSPMLLEFGAGCLIGALYSRNRFKSSAAGALFVSLSLLLLFATTQHLPVGLYERVLYWGLPSALLVIGALCLEETIRSYPSRFLVLLGNASYSIYLSHVLFLLTFNLVIHRLKITGDLQFLIALYLLAGGTIAIIGGTFIYRFVEVPILSASRSWRWKSLNASVVTTRQRVS